MPFEIKYPTETPLLSEVNTSFNMYRLLIFISTKHFLTIRANAYWYTILTVHGAAKSHAIIRLVGKASKKKKGSINEAVSGDDKSKKIDGSLQGLQSKGSLQHNHSALALIPVVIIIFVSFAAYFNALSGDFVFDDQYQIVENPWIRDIGNIPTIFSSSVWSFRPGIIASSYYRPLMQIVYLVSYHLFGLQPWGYHLVNVLFHCGVAVLVFLMIRRFPANYTGLPSSVYLSPPFIGAMLFASHPIHTEAVTWIAGLPDVAFTFFYLLSFYFYLLFRSGIKRVYLWSVLSFLVSTLFKEPALTLPIIMAVYDSLFHKWENKIVSRIKTYIPYIVVSGIYLMMRYYALRSVVAGEFYPLSTYQFIINVFPLFREYVTSVLWPFDLNLWHSFHPIASLVETNGAISMVLTVILFVFMVFIYRKNKIVLFGLLLFIVPLLPALYIKGISWKPFAERYLYLPSVGFVLILTIFLSWARGKLQHTVWSITIVSVAILALYIVETVNRNNVWKNSLTLWSDTVLKAPDSAMAHFNLGAAYASEDRLDEAIKEYNSALAINPFLAPDLYLGLGEAYELKNRIDEALDMYRIALQIEPNYKIHRVLGDAYAKKGLIDQSRYHHQKAMELEKEYWSR